MESYSLFSKDSIYNFTKDPYSVTAREVPSGLKEIPLILSYGSSSSQIESTFVKVLTFQISILFFEKIL